MKITLFNSFMQFLSYFTWVHNQSQPDMLWNILANVLSNVKTINKFQCCH